MSSVLNKFSIVLVPFECIVTRSSTISRFIVDVILIHDVLKVVRTHRSAIMAIENWLDLISGLRITEKKRRNYQAAGLLYYMGYEDWMLPPDSPFPHYLRSDSDICRRYRSLRDHARNYLGATAREAQGEAFRNRLAERQDELINAAIRKGLKLDK